MFSLGGQDGRGVEIPGEVIFESNQSFSIFMPKSVKSKIADVLYTLDSALNQINSVIGYLGAVQYRFTSIVNTLQIGTQDLTEARARIQDADYALEVAELVRGQVLQQAGLAIVAQAKQTPQNILKLLG